MNSTKMNAIVCTQYGGPEVLQWQEVEKPVPNDQEVLIHIHATAANSGDARIRRADPFLIRLIFGFNKPRNPVLGVTVVGQIEAVGKAVTRFKVGDFVFGSTEMRFGAYAEYATMPETGILALAPRNMNEKEAAAVPFGATTALCFLRKANIQKGQKVLIYGASGAVGTAAVQIAKSMGAIVTGVCSTRNIALVERLGADEVIDYTQEDFSESPEKYDVVFETVGKSAFSQCMQVLHNQGTLIMASAGLKQYVQGFLSSFYSRKKVIAGMIEIKPADMEELKVLIEKGAFKAVIDRCYPLEQTAKAHAYVDKGRKKGNVILTNLAKAS